MFSPFLLSSQLIVQDKNNIARAQPFVLPIVPKCLQKVCTILGLEII